jgi:predicted TIM-barrel fold metal-dependent hydrolase
MRIVDTHCHLVYPDRLRYPWLDSVPALNRPFSLETYLRQARQVGITDTIHMEVDVALPDMEAETTLVTRVSLRRSLHAGRRSRALQPISNGLRRTPK